MQTGWNHISLGDACDIINGRNQKAVENAKGKYPIYGSGGIMGYASAYLCKAGSTIIGRKGTINKPIFVNTNFWNVDTAFGLSPKDGINPRFFFYLCKSIDWLRYDKGTTLPSLVKSDLLKIKVRIPETEIQNRIASELDLLSEIIDIKNTQLRDLDDLAQSIFYEMFGDPVANEKGWQLKAIKDSVEEMFLGPFGSSLKTDCYVPKEQSYCMVYEQKHAIKKTLKQDNHFINKDKYNSLKRFSVGPGDFIMSCRGTIGEIYELPNDAPKGIIHPSLMKIRLREGVYSHEFFKVLLGKVVTQQEMNGGVVKMAITAKKLGQIKIVAPPMEKQIEFNEQIERIKEQKKQIEQSLSHIQTLLDKRMFDFFS